MSTIDQLPPAASASDTDEYMVSQAGVAKKITRSQILNGYQQQLTVPPNALLGGSSTGYGAPTAISVGQNLILSGSTLSAAAAPFAVAGQMLGNVPASGDLIAMSQGGTNVAVTYQQFLSGVSAAANVNVSSAIVTPAGSTASVTLAQLAANSLPLSGGTLNGSLVLQSGPALSNQAANKAYVDQQVSTALSLAGGSLSGLLTLASAPQHVLDAATKGYVDNTVSGLLPVGGGSLSGPLLLSSDPASSLQAATKNYADGKIARTGDTMTGTLALGSDPTVAAQAATKRYVDTQVGLALPLSGGTLSGSLLLASDPTLNGQAATKQYVDLRILRAGDTMSGVLTLSGSPTAANQAATKGYVDQQVGGAVAGSGASMTGALLLASDPSVPLQAATKQYVDLRVNRNGDTLTGSLYLAANPTAPLQAASKQYVDSQLATSATWAGGSFTGAVALAGDPTMPLQAATKEYVDQRLQRSGDTLSGPLVLAADPVGATQAATKHYVDTSLASALPLTGGSISGALTLAADPSVSNQAATKHYVDTSLTSALPLKGGSLSGILSLAATPTMALHAATKQYVDTQVATVLPITGGSLTGSLMLSGLPTATMQATTKGYVDANPSTLGVINVKMPPYNAKIDGVTDDTAAFAAAYQAAPSGSVIYVPNGTVVLQNCGSWNVSITKRVKWIVDGTVLSNGTPLASAIPTGGAPASVCLPGFVVGNTQYGAARSQSSSQASDFALNQSAYIVNHTGGTYGGVIANSRNDTIIYNSPLNFIWGGLDRLLWSGTQELPASGPTQHVGRYIQTLREVVTSNGSGGFLPSPQLWGLCVEYRDLTGEPSSATNAALTTEMDWFGNGADSANSRTIQSLVVGQHNTSGAAVEVSNIIGVWLAAGSSGSAKTVLSINLPFSNAILDATPATSINNAPVIKMAAGQAIAFEATNTNRLQFDASTGTLRWYQGTLSYVVGKGISVGWGNVFSSSATLQNYLAGNMIVLTGGGTYAITLPPANSVAAGTGFTFSNIASGTVSILSNGSDAIDAGPICIYPNDRYHIISDGGSAWHEVFRTNAISPRFQAPIVLPSYLVSGLPAGIPAGAKAFASNGRKPTEGVGAGTGVEVFFDGHSWISSCSGASVAA